MTRLLRAELRRFRSRRLVIAALLLALVGTGLATWGVWSSARPLTGASLEMAESQYQAAVADFKAHGAEQMASCLDQQETERVAQNDPTLDFGCNQMQPQREWFFPPAADLASSLRGLVSGAAYLLAFAALLAGTTGTAADLSTGGTSTWLTFEPRRGRVFASKTAAIGLSLIAPAALIVGAAAGTTLLLYRSAGLPTALTAATWQQLGAMGARTVGLVVAAGLAGAALGFLLRHTAAVLGVVVGYLVVVESILAQMKPALHPWTLMTNTNAWLNGPASYYSTICTTTTTGTSCEGVEHLVSTVHGAVFLGVGTVVVIAVAALVFQRRDVG